MKILLSLIFVVIGIILVAPKAPETSEHIVAAKQGSGCTYIINVYDEEGRSVRQYSNVAWVELKGDVIGFECEGQLFRLYAYNASIRKSLPGSVTPILK